MLVGGLTSAVAIPLAEKGRRCSLVLLPWRQLDPLHLQTDEMSMSLIVLKRPHSNGTGPPLARPWARRRLPPDYDR